MSKNKLTFVHLSLLTVPHLPLWHRVRRRAFSYYCLAYLDRTSLLITDSPIFEMKKKSRINKCYFWKMFFWQSIIDRKKGNNNRNGSGICHRIFRQFFVVASKLGLITKRGGATHHYYSKKWLCLDWIRNKKHSTKRLLLLFNILHHVVISLIHHVPYAVHAHGLNDAQW